MVRDAMGTGSAPDMPDDEDAGGSPRRRVGRGLERGETAANSTLPPTPPCEGGEFQASFKHDLAPGDPRLPRRSLLRNSVYAVAGTGFYHACQLGVLVLLNKFASPEVTGWYFLALAIASPVLLFFGFELRGALVADAGGQFSVGTYLALRRTMLLPATAVLAAVFAWQATHDTRLAFLLVVGGMFAARIAWSYAEVGWGTYQRLERLDRVAWSYTLRGLALLVPFAILLPLARVGGVPGAGVGQVPLICGAAVLLHALGYVAAWQFYDRPRVRDVKRWDLRWTPSSLRALGWQTLPLGLVALAINLCDSFPRWLFDSPRVTDGAVQLGYFGSLAYITMAGNLVTIQAAVAAANRLSLYYQRDLRAFLRLGGLLSLAAVGIGVVVMFVAFLFGRWILTTLYTADYACFEPAFRIIVLAHCVALVTNILGAATTQMRLFWVQVPIQLVTLAATGIAAVLLIPGPTPVYGAALTALVRAVVQFVLYGVCVTAGIVLRGRVLAGDPGRVVASSNASRK